MAYLKSMGADPEYFVRREDGTIVPFCGLYPEATKENPVNMGLFSFQEDNVAIELNILPSFSGEELFYNVKEAMEGAEKEVLAPYGLSLAPFSYHEFSVSSLDVNEKAWEFGCSPEWIAWNPKWPRVTSIIKDDPESNIRTTGGHIHIGYDKTKESVINLAKKLDYAVGTWCRIMDEKGKERQRLYGAPGSFRETSYGLEYRYPTNWWTWGSTDYFEYLWELVERAIKAPISKVRRAGRKDNLLATLRYESPKEVAEEIHNNFMRI